MSSSRTTHPGSWKPASQRFSISMAQTKEWSAQHPYLATRNWTLEHGGKKGLQHIRDSLLEDVNKNGCPKWTWESPSELNVLYKSFHIHRNMSSFWSFPLISFRVNLAQLVLTNGLTLHVVHRHWWCWWGQNYLFIALVVLARWLNQSFLPGAIRDSRADPHRPWTSGIHTLRSLCAEVFSQHVSIHPAPVELRAAAHLPPDP